MNDSQNVITISKDGNQLTMFRAPDNPHAAIALFMFLAEHLQPGMVVELASDDRSITQPTGQGGNE